MSTATDVSSRPLRPARPLGERLNLRLWIFLAVVSLPFLWCAWLIVDHRMIVQEGDVYAVDLKSMGNFPFDARRDTEAVIPLEVRKLDGKKVKFEGEMYAPSASSARVRQFQLVYSIVECCMGGPPKVQERVFAIVPDDKHVKNLTGRQVTVTGTLHVNVERDNGEAVAVFTMDVDEVRERT